VGVSCGSELDVCGNIPSMIGCFRVIIEGEHCRKINCIRCGFVPEIGEACVLCKYLSALDEDDLPRRVDPAASADSADNSKNDAVGFWLTSERRCPSAADDGTLSRLSRLYR
jgi:hypothetical protein